MNLSRLQRENVELGLLLQSTNQELDVHNEVAREMANFVQIAVANQQPDYMQTHTQTQTQHGHGMQPHHSHTGFGPNHMTLFTPHGGTRPVVFPQPQQPYSYSSRNNYEADGNSYGYGGGSVLRPTQYVPESNRTRTHRVTRHMDEPPAVPESNRTTTAGAVATGESNRTTTAVAEPSGGLVLPALAVDDVTGPG